MGSKHIKREDHREVNSWLIVKSCEDDHLKGLSLHIERIRDGRRRLLCWTWSVDLISAATTFRYELMVF